MCSNKKITPQIRRGVEGFLPLAQKAANIFSLGMEGKQWVACVMVCTMLLPIFSLPVSASVYQGTNKKLDGFEPVNEQLSVWTESWRNLNAKIESWTTPLRSENAALGKDDADKKKVNKGKEVDSDENTAEKTKEEKTAGNLESKLNGKIDPNSENVKTKREISKAKVKSYKIKALKNKKAPISVQPVLPLIQQADRPILDEADIPSLISPRNNLGNPLGQTEDQSAMAAAVNSIRERAGIGNFQFGFPVASVPGRGINVSIGVSYNSQVWTKSGNQYIYNVDGNWLSPGFQIGYGYLDAYRDGSAPPDSFVLTDPNGTRHSIDYIRGSATNFDTFLYESNDGSFTRVEFERCGSCVPQYQGFLNNMRVTYADGSKIFYSGPNSQNRYFPSKIIDVQGNFISIAYLANDEVGKISTITDTLGRVINFHYDGSSEQKLIAVSVPGYGNSTTPRQTIRFYYENLTLQTTNRFDGTITAPASVTVLKYIYMPGTKTGYRYDYSSYYGMIYKITRLDGMQISTDSTTEMGSVINPTSYVETATTRYNYAGTDVEPPSPTLSDLPKYNKRTDDWIGRTGTTAPETFYNFSEDATTQTTQSTAPDNTTTVTITKKSTGQWDDGLVKETYVTTPDRNIPWTKTIYTWQYGNITRGRKNPRVEKVETVNEAGLSKATTFEYDGYNNQTSIKEHDYAPTGQVGTELRRTETTYQTAGQYNPWVYRNLLHLPLSVKRIINNTIVSRTDYEYDGFDLLSYGANIPQLEPSYNPDTPDGEYCHDECPSGYEDPVHPQICTVPRVTICDPVPVFDASTNYRGNITKVTSFVDVLNNNDPNASVSERRYDITGNVVQATLNCCNVQTTEYSDLYKYAYPTKVIKGSDIQLITQANYDLNTGLTIKTTDANNQDTYYEYEPDTLRQKKVTYPNGSYTEAEYSDKLLTGSNLIPRFVRTKITLDSSHFSQSYNYFDARGLRTRSATETSDGWSISTVEFDILGRPVKSYNPFYVSTPNGAIPNGTKYTEALNFDGLGRATTVRYQDGTTSSTEYSNLTTIPSGFNKTFATVIDQAGKKRRQVMDALARIIRVDEPDATGDLGPVNAPKQPTFYEYDGNVNLTKVTQSDGNTTQERLFKYDALSRLTHEKQVEATPTLNDNGVKVASGGVWTKVFKYNPHGLIIEDIDARGVKTSFIYDALNRVSSISYTGEAGYETPNVIYSYDQARTGFYNKGSLTRMETAAGSDRPATVTEFDYDYMGRAVKHRQTIGNQTYNLEYNYNLSGQLVSEKYPSGKIISTNYDAYGRALGVADASRTYLSGMQYQGKGNTLSSMTFGNNTNETFTYNDRLQLTNQTFSKGFETLQQYDYSYGQLDSNENVLTNQNNGNLAQTVSYIGTQKQWTQRFKYDSIGRLSEAKEYRGNSSSNTLTYKQNFDFDRFGNLYRKSISNPTTGQENPLPYTPTEDQDINRSTNRFTSSTTYDDSGNIISDNKFRMMNFVYDANGQMVKAIKANAPDALSVYNGSGQRVAEKVNDVWRFLIYDLGGKLVAEYGGSQGTDEGGVNYVLRDWQGSTRAIINRSGFVQSRMDYQAYGEEIESGVGLRTTFQGFGSSNDLRQKYGMTERDEGTGLNQTLFRKLETQAGRWTSPDPYKGSLNIGDPQSFNRYSYVENKPTNFIDPSGLNMEEGGVTCVRYHYSNLAGTIGFWGPWSCYSNGGGSGGGGGGGQGSQSKSGIEKCIELLKNLGVWDKVEALLKNPPLIDLDSVFGFTSGDSYFFGGGKSGAESTYAFGGRNYSPESVPWSVANTPGSVYFGNFAIAGETAGQTFDRNTNGGQGAWTVRTSAGVLGIYYRSSRTDIHYINLLLHEVVHLVLPETLPPGRTDLDVYLIQTINIKQDPGQSASDAVSRFFNSGCSDENLVPVPEEPGVGD